MATNCIDVSSYQGSIDWAKVKATGVKYAILRSVVKNLSTDTKFETNYKNARAAGIKVGVYVYAYATTTAYAKSEANALVALLGGRELDLPVFYDLESTTLRTASASTVQDIATAFKTVIEKAGYQCGIYCDSSFYSYKSHFNGFDSDCEFWIASYGSNNGVQHTVPTISHHMCGHQFSSKGSVSGISGNVDVTNWYGLAATASTTTTSTSTTLNKTAKWTGVVTANKLNVRTYAGTNNATVSFSPLAKGTEVSVCDSVKATDGTEWYYICNSAGKYGFVSSKYIEEKTTTTTTTTTSTKTSSAPSKTVQWTGYVSADSLNVRTNAGASYSTCSFSPLSKNDEVGVCDTATASNGDEWYYIKVGTKYGYVNAKYISKTKATTNYRSLSAQWMKTVYDKVVSLKCKHAATPTTYAELQSKKATNCSRTVSIVLQQAGIMASGKLINHKTANGGTAAEILKAKSTIAKSMTGQTNIDTSKADVVYIGAKNWAAVPDKYKVAGAAFIQDSNAFMCVDTKTHRSCNNAKSSQVKKDSSGVYRYYNDTMTSGYTFSSPVLVGIIPKTSA